MIAVAVASRVFFARRSLSTKSRLVLCALAVCLLVLGLLRDGAIDGSGLALIAFAILSLGAGVYYLWRQEKNPPPQ